MKKLLLLACIMYGASHAAQCTWCDGIFEWTGPEGRIPVKNSNCPEDFVSHGYDTGMMYARVEVIEKPTDMCNKFQICSWGGGEGCTPGKLIKFSSTGVYYMNISPQNWWVKSTKDWSKVGNTQAVLKDCNNKWFSTCGGGHCRKTDVMPHVPIKIRLQVYVVSAGSQLKLPDNVDWQCPREWNCVGGTTTIQRFNRGTIKTRVLTVTGSAIQFSEPYPQKVSVSTLLGKRIVTKYSPDTHSLHFVKAAARGAFLLHGVHGDCVETRMVFVQQ